MSNKVLSQPQRRDAATRSVTVRGPERAAQAFLADGRLPGGKEALELLLGVLRRDEAARSAPAALGSSSFVATMGSDGMSCEIAPVREVTESDSSLAQEASQMTLPSARLLSAIGSDHDPRYVIVNSTMHWQS